MKVPMNRAYSLLLLAVLVSGCPRKNPSGKSAQIPIIDSHVHITPTKECEARSLKIFEANGITRFCTKSAGVPGSPRFLETLKAKQRLGDRIAFFSNLDWRGIDHSLWGQREAKRLAMAVSQGARGFKIFKNLGLGVRTRDGRLLPVDDPRLDPVFEKAAALGAIAAIHTGDPLAFFEPPTPENQRYLELLFAPSWSFHGEDLPSRKALLDARDRLLARHTRTTFLGIHLANNPEDIDYLDRLLTKHPNLYVDTSARLGEIGRHPAERVREFFIKHQDRILFGSDLVVSPSGLQLGSLSIWPDDDSDANRFYQAHREYFETDHQGIDHPTPIQGAWKVDAINLPRKVLDKVYRTNALKLIWKKPDAK
jgi:predicted TIM-barrel fold metal-dependent hydrolase